MYSDQGKREEKNYKIAGINLKMTLEFDRTKKQAEAYLTDEVWDENDDVEILDLPHDFYEANREYRGIMRPLSVVEYSYTGSLFNRYLLNHNGCMLHSSAIVVDGYAYLFSADSGTGKSTHTQLWLKHFGDKAFIINDDKPAIVNEDGQWYVYGTPWSGKTDLNVNTRVKLGAIVFLERSEDNWIKEMPTKMAVSKFFMQTIRRLKTEENIDKVLSVMEKILLENPVYQLGCNMNEDAVKVSYEAIRRV